MNEHMPTPMPTPEGHPLPPWQSGPPPISHPFPQQPHPHPQYRQPLPQQFPEPFEQARASRTRPVLVIAAVVAFAVAGVFGGLYVVADGDRDAAVSLLDERKGQLAEARERLGAAESEQAAAQDRNADLEAEGTELRACVDAVQHYLWDDLTEAETTAAIDAMFTACE